MGCCGIGMLYIIENDLLTLSVSTTACEMHSLKRKGSNYEYLWNGDPTYWKGRNPLLFPQVSSTSTKTNIIDGKEYPMGNHGFARNSEFELVSKEDDKLVFLLKDNEETHKQYPFSFEIYVTYSLKDNSVLIDYEVVNTNDRKMPFGFGLHPGFMASDGLKESYITFNNGNKLELSYELFDKYPTYFEEPTPSSATLHTNGHKLTLDFEGFKHLAIWSPKAPFVCIEPWMNLNVRDDRPFEEREENIVLDPSANFKIGYSITVD